MYMNVQTTWMDVHHEFMVHMQWAQITIVNMQKSTKSTDKGLFTKNNTHSLVECSHVKAMLGQQEALE